MTSGRMVAAAVALLGCLGCPAEKLPPTPPTPPAAPTAITFHPQRIAVGMSWVRLVTSDSDSTVVMLAPDANATPATGPKTTTKEIDERKIEILGVAEGRATQVKATYLQKSRATTGDEEKHEPTRSPVVGKTYLVERRGSAVVVTAADRSPAPPEEADIVAKDFAQLGDPDVFLMAIPDHPLHVGDKVDAMANALREKITRGDSAEVSDVAVQLAEIRPSRPALGAFEYRVTATFRNGESTRTTKIKGVDVVRESDRAEVEEDDEIDLQMSKVPIETEPGSATLADVHETIRLHVRTTFQ